MRGKQAKRKESRSATSPQLDLFSRSSIAPPLAGVLKAEEGATSISLGPSIRKPVNELLDRGSDDALATFVLAGRRRGRPEKSLNEESDGPSEPSDLVDVRGAAKILGLSKSTLDKMRCSGKGPPFVRATDRAVRYDPKDLKAFKSNRRYRSTSDLAGLSAD